MKIVKPTKYFRVAFILSFFLLGFLCIEVEKATAETIYINPTCSNNGNGTGQSCAATAGGAGAKNTWNDATWTAGNLYLQQRGTTTTESIAPSASGTASQPIIIGAYGSGARPVIKLSAGTRGLFLDHRNYIVVQDIEFRAGTKNVNSIYSDSVHDFTIRRCKFSGTTPDGTTCTIFFNSQSYTYPATIYNINIEECEFVNLNRGILAAPIFFYLDGGPGYTAHDIAIRKCDFDNVGFVVRLWGSEANFSNPDNTPYGFVFDDNVVNNTSWSVVAITQGIKSIPGHPSSISRNTLTSIGIPTNPNINAIQLCWVRDIVVEDNSINGVFTSLPDGEGIILDSAYYKDEYSSEGVIVRRNIVTGCNASPYMAGIGIWAAKNCKIYNNYSYGNSNGAGICNPGNTNNIWYNNTFINNAYNGFLLRGIDKVGAPFTTLINNIIANNGSDGIAVCNNSTVPMEHHNCIFGNGGHAFWEYGSRNKALFLAATDITSNPQLSTIPGEEYYLMPGSPCINAGTTNANVATDIRMIYRPQNSFFDIGAYEYSNNPPPTCEDEPSTIVAVNIVDLGDGIYDYTFTDETTGNPIIQIEGYEGLIDLNGGFDINYENEGSKSGVSITSLTLAPGTTESILLPPQDFLCAIDDNTHITDGCISTYMNTCQNSPNRIVWSDSTGNKCEGTGSTTVNGKDANGIETQYTCEEVEIGGQTYVKMSGFTHTAAFAGEDPNEIDDDYDGYTENQGDCNDSNAMIHPGAIEASDGLDNNCNGETDEGFVPPVANAGPKPDITVGIANFDGSGSFDPDGTIVSWDWNIKNLILDDTKATTGSSPTVTGLEPGIYKVTLTVIDDDGLTDTDTMTVNSCFISTLR